jgi:hypothetical protein
MAKKKSDPLDNLKPKGKTALERFIQSRKGPSQLKKEREQRKKG